MNTRRSLRNKPANAEESIEKLEVVKETNNRESVSSKFDTESSDSDDEPLKKPDVNTSLNRKRAANSSSSDSSVGDYLKNPDDIDLSSSFFQRIEKTKPAPDFDCIEKNIFSGIQKTLSDSDESENETIQKEEIENEEPVALEDRMHFTQLHEYNRKLEEAKACVQNYENKTTRVTVKKIDITQMLSVGEKNNDSLESMNTEESEDEMDWQEIAEGEEKPTETIKIPKDGVQITLAMPVAVKKKKGVDLMAAIKRRINRIKKENQVHIHKVHLLCWIAHGNYINTVLNNENLLGSALSLIPSENCYPPKHADISYLEQIVRWYGNTMKLKVKMDDEKLTPVLKSLQGQMSKKLALSKRDFVLMFIIVLRSLGLQCRLMFSLQTVPIRPPNSELCSLSTKEESKKEVKKENSAGPSTSKSSNKLNKSINNNKLNKSKSKIAAVKSKTSVSNNSKNVKQKKGVQELPTNNTIALSDFQSQLIKAKTLKNVSTKTSKIKIDEKIAQKPSSTLLSKTSKTIETKSKVQTLETSSSNNNIDLSQFEAQPIKNKIFKNVSNITKNKASSSEIKIKENSTKKSSSNSKKINTKNEQASSEVETKVKMTARSSKKTIDTSSRKSSVSSMKLSVIKNEQSTSVVNTTTESVSSCTKETKEVKPKRIKASSNSATTELTVAASQKPSNNTEMFLLDTKTEDKNTNNSKTIKKIRNKSVSTLKPSSENNTRSTRSRTKSLKSDVQISQLDGADDETDDETDSESTSARIIIKELLIPQLDGANDGPSTSKSTITKPSRSKSPSSTTSISKNRRAKSEKHRYVDHDSESDFQPSSSSKSPSKKSNKQKDINDNKRNSLKKLTSGAKIKLDVRNDIINLIKGNITEQRHSEKRKSGKKEESDYDSEYEPEPVVKKRRSLKKSVSEDEFQIKMNTKVKRRVKPRSQLEIDNRVLSTDSEESIADKKKKNGNDVWAEVFLESEEKWISVDVINAQVHCISELHSRASQPISYILAWNNNFSLKDVTARYCQNWNTVTRKLRIDATWWNETLKPFIGIKSARDREEDEDLARQQLDKPLPKTINEYKNHPLYVLRRHLLKFEAIYPPDALTLGFVRGEAVYARECVYTLHSREIWVKHAKVVKPKQEPYKIVKARPKYDKLTGNTISDLPLEIFGKWQVEDYDPPTAENGVVPRNSFGNVELFKACMLPKKTVHLQLPGLNKVARKLQIDCAPAVVGFEYHCGGSVPTFDGYVVCEEFEDTLIAAWEQEQVEKGKRELEKYEKRVYGNWRKLIKAALICERLKVRYNFGKTTDKDKNKKKGGKVAVKKRRICSDNESDSG